MATERERLLAELDYDSSTYPSGKKDFQTLLQQFTNETMAPEILPYADVAVERISNALQSQEMVIENEFDPFTKMLYQIEYDRVKFLLSSYLRARLLKIERYAQHIIQDDDLVNRLSSAERSFCTKYADLEKSALTNGSFLKRLDESLLETSAPAINRPLTEQHVFCKVLADIGRVQFDEGDGGAAIDLNQDDTYVLSYDSVKTFVDDGRIKLI